MLSEEQLQKQKEKERLQGMGEGKEEETKKKEEKTEEEGQEEEEEEEEFDLDEVEEKTPAAKVPFVLLPPSSFRRPSVPSSFFVSMLYVLFVSFSVTAPSPVSPSSFLQSHLVCSSSLFSICSPFHSPIIQDENVASLWKTAEQLKVASPQELRTPILTFPLSRCFPLF